MSLPRSKFAEAKDLLRWVLDTAANGPEVEPLPHLSGELIVSVDARQVGLFG